MDPTGLQEKDSQSFFDFTISAGANLTGTNPVQLIVNVVKEVGNNIQDYFNSSADNWFAPIDQLSGGTLSSGPYIDNDSTGSYLTYGSGTGTPELVSVGLEIAIYGVKSSTALEGISYEQGQGFDIEKLGALVGLPFIDGGVQASTITNENSDVIGYEANINFSISPLPVDIHYDVEQSTHIELINWKNKE